MTRWRNTHLILADEARALEERLRVTLGLTASPAPIGSRDRTGSGPEFRLSPTVVDTVRLHLICHCLSLSNGGRRSQTPRPVPPVDLDRSHSPLSASRQLRNQVSGCVAVPSMY